MPDYLHALEQPSIHVIRESHARLKPLARLWSLGKVDRRYRSLGESDITFPIESDAATIPEIIAELEQTRQSERAGRAMDREREDTFERLRAAGYM